MSAIQSLLLLLACTWLVTAWHHESLWMVSSEFGVQRLCPVVSGEDVSRRLQAESPEMPLVQPAPLWPG